MILTLYKLCEQGFEALALSQCQNAPPLLRIAVFPEEPVTNLKTT